jgi:hypothetical protein
VDPSAVLKSLSRERRYKAHRDFDFAAGGTVVDALRDRSEIADLRKLRREVAETWPENTSREMALLVLDALVCKLSQAPADAE